MSELMNPRIPGLGLAPASASRDASALQRDAILRDALIADASASRTAAGPIVDGAPRAIDGLPRRARGIGAGRAAAVEAPVACRPSQPGATA
jgi:hypothetical protein